MNVVSELLASVTAEVGEDGTSRKVSTGQLDLAAAVTMIEARPHQRIHDTRSAVAVLGGESAGGHFGELDIARIDERRDGTENRKVRDVDAVDLITDLVCAPDVQVFLRTPGSTGVSLKPRR